MKTCYICGGPVRSSNKTGVCAGRTKACVSERNRLWQTGRSVTQIESRNADNRRYFAQLSAERRKRRGELDRTRRALDPSQSMVTAARRRRRDGITVTITKADVLIPAHCPICRVVLAVGVGASSDRSPSLDRYDPKLGYVPGNVMVICRGCNRRKQDHTGEQLVKFGYAVMTAKVVYDAQLGKRSAA